MNEPNTTEAVADAMREYGKRHDMHRMRLSPAQDTYREAEAALAADRQALTDAGFAIVKVGSIPPWMFHHSTRPDTEVRLYGVDESYRLSPTEGSKS